MPKPRRVPGPTTPGWTVELTVAGLIWPRHWPPEAKLDAMQAFHRAAAKIARGGIDRVVLWNGSACVDAASPGATPATRQPTRISLTEGLDMLAGPPIPSGPAARQAHADTPITDLERLCHCGAPVREFMSKCPGCPGPSGAGFGLRQRGPSLTATKTADEMGL